GPLVLLVAARRAPGKVRLAVAQRHRRRERCAGPLAGRERVGMALVEPELLRAGAEAEAKLRDHRRGLQPTARWRRRHHVAVAVDDVEVHGIAAHGAGAFELRTLDRQAWIDLIVMGPGSASDRRLAGARSSDAPTARNADVELHAVARNRARPLVERRAL